MTDPAYRQRINRRFLMAAGLTVLASVALCWVRVRDEDHELRKDILQQATLISWAMNADQVASLNGSAADLDHALYQRIKAQLVTTRALFPQCRFLYLMRRTDDGQIIFLADSEPPESENYSPPGQVYEEATPAFRAVFSKGQAATEGPVHDRWGRWISASIPLFHPFSDRVIGVLGMDIDARQWRAQILEPVRIPLLFTALLLLVLGVGYLGFRRPRRSAPWHPACSPECLLTLALGLTLTALSTYLAHDHEHRIRRDAFRRIASAQASLVQQSIFRIGDNYLEGLARFFVGSEFVDRREFRDYAGYLLLRPYAQAWEWVPVVSNSVRASFETAVREGGAPDFLIWEAGPRGERLPAAGRELYYPVCYVEPLAGNESVLGYDLSSEPIRRAALESAARTGLATATDPVTLLQRPGRGNGVIVFRPVYAKDDQRLAGFGVVVLRMDVLLYRALSRESTRDETANRVSLFQLDPESAPIHLASNDPSESRIFVENKAPFHRAGDLNALLAPIYAFGKVYAFVSRPGQRFAQLYPVLAGRRTAWTGLVLTALVSVLVTTLNSRREALEQKVADRTAELRASESSYHGLFNAIQQAIYILDETGTFIDVNDGALAMYGYTRQELVGLNPEKVSAPGRNDLGAAITALQRALAGEPQYMEFWGQRKNGEAFPKEIWLYPGTYFGRSVVVAVAADISERKRAEQELKDAHERLTTFVEAIPDTVQIKDAQGRWLIINEAAVHLFAVEHFPWRGKTEQELAESRPAHRAMHESCDMSDEVAWQGPGVSIHTEVVPGPDGKSRIYEVRKLPLFEADGRRKALIAIGRDITERKQAEDEKEHLQSQLAQAQKMESVGRLAGGVAHDFNNMLQAILGNATLALDESPGGPLSEYLIEIKKSAQRSADLTRQLLAFASRQTVSPRVIDLNDTISGMLKMLRRLIGEDIQLMWVPGSDLWPVKVDPSQIDQIMANLAVNARDAIGGVGTVTIETSNFVCVKSAERPLYANCLPGEYVRLIVRDTGKGMDEETRTHIFEPFYTTKGPGKGVGLGLATIFGIVKQNKGFIHVESEPGLGSTFHIGLPRTQLAAPALSETVAPLPVRGGPETLLLVEDEMAILRFGQEGLRRLGYQVLIANSPGQALDVARQHRGPIHLLITDVVLPEMNGRELAQLLSALTPDLRCLFMSGYTADIIAHRGVLDEKVHFIQKPFSLEAFALKIREVLDLDTTRPA